MNSNPVQAKAVPQTAPPTSTRCIFRDKPLSSRRRCSHLFLRYSRNLSRVPFFIDLPLCYSQRLAGPTGRYVFSFRKRMERSTAEICLWSYSIPLLLMELSNKRCACSQSPGQGATGYGLRRQRTARGIAVQRPSGAKIFVKPDHYVAVVEAQHVTRDPCPYPLGTHTGKPLSSDCHSCGHSCCAWPHPRLFQ